MEHFTQDGHLSEAGMARCVDALKLRQEDELPEAIRAHLEGCAACMHEVAGLYAALAEVDYADLGPQAAEKRATGTRGRWLRLGLALTLALASWWAYQRQQDAPAREQPEMRAPQAAPQAPADSLAPRRPVADGAGPGHKTEGRQPATRPTEPSRAPVDEPEAEALYAANFEPNEDWEGLVGGVVRGEGPAEVQPAPDARFKPGERISFRWEADATDWKLKIYNNRGKVLLEQPAAAGLKWMAPELPGLYYWSLENEADLQYVGKFAVIR
jgi:hypothetical protein